MTLSTRLLLALLGVGWGLHIVLTKSIGAEGAHEALALLVLYMLAASTGLVILGMVRSRLVWPTWRHLEFYLLGSCLGYLGPILVELLVAPQIDAALLALINATSPIFTLAVALPVRAAKLTRRVGIALVLGTGAALVILAPSIAMPASAALGWVLAGFLLPLIYGIDNVYVQVRWPRELDSFQVAAGEAVTATVVSITVALLWGVRLPDLADGFAKGGPELAGLAAVAVGTVWLYFHLVHHAGGVAVSFAGFVSIATGVVLGFLMFGERPDLWVWGACVLTVAALWVLRHEKT